MPVLLFPPSANDWLPSERALLDEFATALAQRGSVIGKYEWVAEAEIGFVIRVRPAGCIEVCRRGRRYHLNTGSTEMVAATLKSALAEAWAHCLRTRLV